MNIFFPMKVWRKSIWASFCPQLLATWRSTANHRSMIMPSKNNKTNSPFPFYNRRMVMIVWLELANSLFLVPTQEALLNSLKAARKTTIIYRSVVTINIWLLTISFGQVKETQTLKRVFSSSPNNAALPLQLCANPMVTDYTAWQTSRTVPTNCHLSILITVLLRWAPLVPQTRLIFHSLLIKHCSDNRPLTIATPW